ncbi:MAG: hypothetical protein WD270_04195 [Acetobacterales bacterium]
MAAAKRISGRGYDDAEIAAVCRARDYPYPPFAGCFVFQEGEARAAAADRLPREGRVPVLAYGSNRAPAQLFRKFGPRAEAIGVETVDVWGCEVVFCARLSSYGALPAMLQQAEGTTVRVAVTWLTDRQLEVMDVTEGLREGEYRRVVLPWGSVTGADGLPLHGVETYDSPHPALYIGGGPVALSAVEASGRVLPAMSCAAALAHAHGHLSPDMSCEDAILRSIRDHDHREELCLRLREGLPPL